MFEFMAYILNINHRSSQSQSQTQTQNRYQFKLDKWTDQGPTINAAFASANAEDVRELHLITAAMIRNSPSAAILEYTDARSAGDDSSGYFSAGSNPTFARASGSGKYTYKNLQKNENVMVGKYNYCEGYEYEYGYIQYSYVDVRILC
jgi:hypothetical protein